MESTYCLLSTVVGIKLAILMMISALVISDSFALYYLECFYLFSPAWNLKYNMAHEYGYSISELNEDDRRKVEEIKAKLFGQGRTTDLSEVCKKSKN